MRHSSNGKEAAGKRDVTSDKTCRDQMSAERAHLIRLLNCKNARGVRTRLEVRPNLIRTRGLDYEVRTGARTAAGGIASSGPQAIRGPGRQLSYAHSEVLAFYVWIE